MEADFDPYYKWLGIPPDEQPADHYRLLGVRRFEPDPEVIESAADRQMAHVRSFQSGKRSEISQRVLNEIAAAKVCLLNDANKAKYDEQLKREQAAARKADQVLAVAEPVDETSATSHDSSEAFVGLGASASSVSGPLFDTQSTAPSSKSSRRAKSKSPLRTIAEVVLGGAAGVAIAIAGLWYGMGIDPFGLFSAGSSPQLTHENSVSGDPSSDPDPTLPRVKPTVSSSPPDSPPNNPLQVTPPSFTPLEVAQPEAAPTQSDESAKAANAEPLISDVPSSTVPVRNDDESSTATTQTVKAIPPQAGEDVEALTKIRQLFEQEYATAKSHEEKVALANLLLRSGKDMQENETEKFVLLRIARDIFNTEGELSGSLAAIAAMDQSYQIDLLQQQGKAYLAVLQAPLDTAARQQLLKKSQAFVEQMTAQERFDIALPVTEEVMSMVRKLNDIDTVKATAAWRKEIQARAEEQSHLVAMRETLATDPDNGEANLTLGIHFVVTEQDWERALPHLAKANDPLIQSIAATEQTNPVPALTAADGWWNAADLRKDLRDGAFSEALKARAVHWYRAAWSGASQLERRKIEQRVGAETEFRMEPDDWTLHCWVDRQWRPHPLELIEHSGDGNEVWFRNNVDIHTHVQLRYLSVVLRGDFYLELEIKGTPRTLGLVILEKRDAKGSAIELSSPDWKRLILRRTAGEMACEFDGKPHEEFFFWNAEADLVGPPEIAIQKGNEVAIRNMLILQ